MILFIDSTDFNNVTYALIDAGKVKSRAFKVDPHKSHETLQKLELFLKKFQIPNSKFQKIYVNKGPGSYTGTRVGVTHALALGFAWGVKVVAIAKEKVPADLAKLK